MLRGKEFHFSDNDFNFIAKLIHKEAGIVLSEHKKDMVYARLVRRLRQLNIDSFSEYIKLINNSKDELPALFNALTTNLTNFFRENHHFEFLDQMLREQLKNKSQLKIWSAGCSMGCESYSIAMVIKKVLNSNQSKCDVKILATDIDTNALDAATKGEYNVDMYEKIPDIYKEYVILKNNKFIVKDHVKELVSFKRLNLLDQWPMKGKFDLIFCRNTVIYFDKETQKLLFRRFYQQLQPQGFVILGHSESMMNISDDFKLIGKTIYEAN